MMNFQQFLNNNTTYGLNGLDLKLKEFLIKPNGFFIEAGANDGITQSNTKIFEEFFGWKGLLIEPSVSSFDKCKRNRPEAIVVNALLSDKDEMSVSGDFDGHLMSSVNGSRRRNNNNLVTLKSKTLTTILKEHNIQTVDFFSLDVEGFEFDVLNGFDFNLWKPEYILIEINNNSDQIIDPYLHQFGYKKIKNLSNFNLNNNPLWDGTHNDFLYKLI